jgi:hypothetical protein
MFSVVLPINQMLNLVFVVNVNVHAEVTKHQFNGLPNTSDSSVCCAS